LVDVAAWSSKRALAVGWHVPPHGRALVALWNGTAWRTLSSRALPWAVNLEAVALFPGGAWAVGQYGNAEHKQLGKPLIARVTDTTVRRVPVPGPEYGWLADVAATSATHAWAVGSASGNASGPPLIVHWNGTAWTRARLPATVREGLLYGVAATSRTNAWAVTGAKIVHWNGRRWDQVVTPHIGSYGLSDVAATSATNAWATAGSAGSDRALILHWNGRRWTCALTPFPSQNAIIHVSASSADNAWAVGSDGTGRILALHWNGHTSKRS